MLKNVGEGKEPSFSCHDSAYFLHFGPILFNAVEFFDSLMIILSKISVTKARNCIAKESERPLFVGRRIKYLVM